MRGRLRGFSEPVNSDEPATKAYADSKASDSLNDAKTYTNNGFWTGTATISRSAWSGSTAPYTNNVSVSGLVANGTVFVDMIASSTFATAEKQAESYGHIYRMVAENGKIICYAKEKPEVDISIQIFKVVQR